MTAGFSILRAGAACALAALGPAFAAAQTIPAFPGADGAAANVAGGRGGIVYHVTKLDLNFNDAAPGTLRYGLNSANFPAGTKRTIVFDVAGVFWLGRYGAENGHDNGWDTASRYNLGSDVTVAGQTAPGPVYIMGGLVKASGNNAVLRNVSIAPGYGMRSFSKPEDGVFPTPGDFPDSYVYDAIDITGTNLMVDHVSTYYSTDETISANELANNVTIQYSNISQGQNYPQADAEASGVTYTGHALGSLLQGGTNSKFSVHHNLYAHQKGRLPRVGSEVGTGAYNDFRNNVFYNWLGTGGSGAGGQPSFNNFVGNFWRAGPGGDNPVGGSSTAIANASGGTSIFSGSNSSGTRVFHSGNLKDTNKDADANDGVALTSSDFGSSSFQANPQWSGGAVTYNGVTDGATAAYSRVLDYMGSRWWDRDAVDARIVNEVRTGTGKIKAWADDPFNSDPNEGVEWRNLLSLRANPATGAAPFNRAANWDADGDGMRDLWELGRGLNPAVADNNGDFDNDGYTNLEEYINEIAVWPAPGPIVFNAATNSRYAQITNWDANSDPAVTHNWQPSRYDVAEIRSGAAVVDAVGQHAGTLRVAPGSGESAMLNVTAGWIGVDGTLEVGAGGSATVNHSGGIVSADPVSLGGAAGGVGVYHLSGMGVLGAGMLEKASAASQFVFTGGTLSVELVTFDLINDGGLIAAATGPTVMAIQGDLTINAGSMRFDLAGPSFYDEVHILGDLQAGGTLSVVLFEDYVPEAGDSFDLLDFESATGAFAFDFPQLGANLEWDTSKVLTTGELAVVAASTPPNADFDGDGNVDGSDFLTWQRGLGLDQQTSRVNGDANGDGVVDADDLIVWQQQFGTMPQAATTNAAVPEPATLWLAALAVIAGHTCRGCRRCMTMAVGTVGALALAAPAHAQIKAFPQAEGFGATALGGRGGDVYHVTNLNDSGAGSLRFGLDNAPGSGRTIVFDVGGWITLSSKLGLTRNRVTIAGHTAPGGVGIRNGQFSVGADDVIVRHMRFRPGKITNTDHDSINTNENAQRVIYDHISAEFSTDGGFDLQADEVTLQYSSVSFGLISHSTGGLIQSPTGGAAGELSFHHNMFAHNETRNPKARSQIIDWRDNVVYNYHNGFLAGESETNVEPNWRANFDGNTYISNSGGNSGSGGRPMMTGGRTQNYDLYYGVNALDRDSDAADDPIVYTKAQAQASQTIVSSQYNWFDAPFAAAEVWQSGSPAAAYTRVLAEFGATPWARDAVNQLIHNQVLSRTGQRISNENQLGIANAGYPNLNPNSLTAPLDSDGDGMPDAWESKHGLDPFAGSNNGDFDNDGYTNLEEYLNDLGGFKATGALEFDGTGRYADWSNWTRRWEPSRLDDVDIPTGTAAVDAVGQRAGLLRVGSAVGQTALLDVTSGWIEVSTDLQVGGAGAGVVTQTGGVVRVVSGAVTLSNGSYYLNGGELVTPEVVLGTLGALNLNGGVLHAGSVTGSLVNRGTRIALGASPGLLEVTGDMTFESGTLEIEIAGTSAGQFDKVVVAGALAAGGVLDVNLLGGFVPAAGDSFDLLDFSSASGAFTLDLPTLAPALNWDTSALLTSGVLSVQDAATLSADFNGDGMVDADDLAVWQLGFGFVGQTDNSAGDANGDGVVDGGDFLMWQQQLGSNSKASPTASAPEPAAIAMIAAAGMLLLASRRQARRGVSR